MLKGTHGSRTIQIPGSTGLEDVQQPIVTYELERHEVGGEVYQISAIHVSGGLSHIGEFVVMKDGGELENLRVDFKAKQTVSEADELGEVTTYTPGDALRVLRRLPFDVDQSKKVGREADFKRNLELLE